MKIVFHNILRIRKRIYEFYINAKIHKYNHSYGWDEILKDIDLAQNDTNFMPYRCSKTSWIEAGYKAVINKRGWVFAYQINENKDMVIYDTENKINLQISTNDTENLELYQQLHDVKSSQEKPYHSLGYGWWAIRHEDGYIYLHNKSGGIMPNIRFNEMYNTFRKRRDDTNIYAIGIYGGKKFKIYLNGKCTLLENRYHIILPKHVFRELITECVKRIIKKIV